MRAASDRSRRYFGDEPGLCFFDDVIDNLRQISRLLKNTQLTVRPGSVLQNAMNVVNLVSGTQFVHNVVHEIQILVNQVPTGTSIFLPKSIILPSSP
jgi:hypothetical protein